MGITEIKRKEKANSHRGLLTNSEGILFICLRQSLKFKNNTRLNEPSKKWLFNKKITLLGDRVMFSQAQKNDLSEQISYIIVLYR